MTVGLVPPASDRPDICVVVPTRNRSELLHLALRSVLLQQGVSFEVVIVDDASTDDTAAGVMALNDPRLRVLRHDVPRGVSAARNRGIAAARADWVAFLDDDDLWAPTKLSEQLRAARQAGALWVYTGHVNVNINGRVTGGEPPRAPQALLADLRRHNVVPGGCSGVIVARRALSVSGCFDEALQPLADWDLWLRLAEVGTPACVSEPLTAYRVHGHQMSLNAARIEAEFPVIAARAPEADKAILYRYLAWWALRVGNQRDALRFFIRAFSADRQDGRLRRLAGEVAGVAGAIVASRLHLSPRAAKEPDLAIRTWRARGQAWIDALIQPAGEQAPEASEPCGPSR